VTIIPSRSRFLADDIITSEVPAMKQRSTYQARQCSVIAVERVSWELRLRHRRPAGRRPAVRSDSEKLPPAEAPSDLAIIGRYILMPEIFGHLTQTAAGRGGEIQLTDGLRSLLRQQEIYAFRFRGTRYDAGDKLGFLKATVEIALQRPDLGARFRSYLRGLDLDVGADKPPVSGGAKKKPAARPKRRRRPPAARRRKRRS
jgi:UTP--glucose-1-phosphate uridylyltransferase